MLPVSCALAEPLHEVGGYRVVRTLALSRHGARLLVHAEGRAWVARVFSTDCPDAVVDHEVAVSDAVRSCSGPLRDHALVVHDLGTTDDGRVVLIEEHLAGPKLDALLRHRAAPLALGEAVTMLAPLVSAIDHGHRIGLTGLLHDTSAVRLRASGAPVLTRRRTASVGPPLPERFRDREPRYAADREAIERVGDMIAASLAEADAVALRSVMRLRGPSLEHALFDLAPPLPVTVESEHPVPEGSAAAAAAPPRAVGPAVPAAAPNDEPVAGSDPAAMPLQRARAALVAALDALGLPASMVSAVRDAAQAGVMSLARWGTGLRGAAVKGHRGVRLRFVVAGSVGAAALVLAIALTILSADTDAHSADEGRGAPSDGAIPAAGENAGSTADGSSVGLAETELHPDPETWPAVIEHLVTRWIDCTRAQPVGMDSERRADDAGGEVTVAQCAAAVAHDRSAAAALIAVDDPRHALLLAWHRSTREVVVVERMGAAVLVDLIVENTATASLLVVRSEAGWRIRDVIG